MPNTPNAAIFAVLAVCIGIGAPIAARAQGPASPASRWTEITLSSTVLGEERKIFVATPFGYETSNRSYPVLVLLDANDAAQFNSAITTVRFLTDRQAIPPLVIVGVPNGKDRTRDLTPPATGQTAAAFPTAGGADKLFTFITREALPAAREKYRLTDYAMLAGHSFGGLFALHVASTYPGSFRAIIAMSPSIWWNDSTPVKQYAEAIGQSRTPLRLFVANGAHEGSIDRPTSRFDKMLDEHHSPELSFGHTRYADASHNLVPISGLLDGLQFIFRPISLAVTAIEDESETFHGDSARLVNTFRDFEQSFREAVRSYPGPAIGVSDTLPEATLRTLAGATLDQLKMPGAASVLFEHIVDLFPTSPRAHMGLARALVATADTGGARNELVRARELTGSDSTLRKNIDARIRELGRP